MTLPAEVIVVQGPVSPVPGTRFIYQVNLGGGLIMTNPGMFAEGYDEVRRSGVRWGDLLSHTHDAEG